MTTLTEFLLARIAEDEAESRQLLTELPPLSGDAPFTVDHPARALAECEAKRRIVERLGRVGAEVNGGGRSGFYADAVYDCARDLSLVYADHPDYREEWRS